MPFTYGVDGHDDSEEITATVAALPLPGAEVRGEVIEFINKMIGNDFFVMIDGALLGKDLNYPEIAKIEEACRACDCFTDLWLLDLGTDTCKNLLDVFKNKFISRIDIERLLTSISKQDSQGSYEIS